jgi:amino acid adenylation domain-containing protein
MMDRNAIAAGRFQHVCLHRLFEAQAVAAPDAVAVVCETEKLSYAGLEGRANRLANYLQKLGVKPGVQVGVFLERSVDTVVALLAVLKAGGAYVPIDPTYPPESISFVLADASILVLVTQSNLAQNYERAGTHLLSLDTGREDIDRESADAPAVAITSEDVAYIIYTSGSTGKPKGVMVTHHNVVRLLKATEPWFHFNAKDIWTLFHSFAFDFSVWEMWGCLLYGGRLVIVPYSVTRSPQTFYNLLAREGVTVLNQTPAAFYQLIQVEESGSALPLQLRFVIFGGEALNFTKLQPWFRRHGDQQPQLVNMYGITETTVHVTYRPLAASDAGNENRSLIGIPIPDLRVYLLDSDQRPVPLGTIGEIYVGGAGVAKGYLNRPELTAERFIADPFAGTPHARMYKSGDLARYLTENDLEYIGRGDSQVKIRGFRIELREIEVTLESLPAIRHSAVIAREDGGDKRLVAYVVMCGEAGCTIKELRQQLRAKLPSHMIPALFVPMDSLPLSPNGKVDRAALPNPVFTGQSEAVTETSYSELEQSLVDLWRRVLRIEHVGLDDNFFDLGGDSLLLFEIHTSVQKTRKMTIPVTDLFEFTTVRALAKHLDQADDEGPSFSELQRQAQKQREVFARARARQVESLTPEERS